MLNVILTALRLSIHLLYPLRPFSLGRIEHWQRHKCAGSFFAQLESNLFVFVTLSDVDSSASSAPISSSPSSSLEDVSDSSSTVAGFAVSTVCFSFRFACWDSGAEEDAICEGDDEGFATEVLRGLFSVCEDTIQEFINRVYGSIRNSAVPGGASFGSSSSSDSIIFRFLTLGESKTSYVDSGLV